MNNLSRFFLFTAITILLFTGDLDESTQFGFRIIQDTEARVGRPLTPVSVAGVNRRTRRRTAVATAAVVAPVTAAAVVTTPATVVVPVYAIGTIVTTLPGGCSSVTISGASYFSCNGSYFKPAFQGEAIVYMVVEDPS